MSKKNVSENEIFGGTEPTLKFEIRNADDNRPPCSPLTYEQYKQAEKILEECQKDSETKPESRKRLPSNNPKFPYYKVFQYFQDIIDTSEADGLNSSCCIVCGDRKDRANTPVGSFCFNCYRKIRNGHLPGFDNIKNCGNVRKLCKVCGEKPADPNMNGICKTCYRRGDLLRDHSLETITELYHRRMEKKRKTNKEQNVSIVKEKNWGIDI